MGRVLFELDPVPDPLEQVVEPVTQPGTQQGLGAPVSGGRVLFQMEPEPETEPTIAETIGRGLKGEAEIALAVGTGIGTDILGGLVGTVQGLNPFAQEGAAVEAFDFVKQFAFKPGPAGQEIAIGIGQIAETLTPDVVISMAKAFNEDLKFSQEDIFQKYGPVAATAFALVLPAVLETTAGYATIKGMRGLATTRADEAIQQTEDALRELGVDTKRIDIQPEDKTIKQIGEDMADENTKDLIDAIKPNTERLEAAQRLGVNTNPSAYSDNAAYVALEQGLKSKPDNKLRQIENESIEQLGQKADELIEDLGGAIDKGTLNVAVKKEYETVLAKLDAQASKDYNIVNDEIPKSQPTIPETSRIYIEKRLEDLQPDIFLLKKAEKDLAKVLGLPRKKVKNEQGEEVEIPDEELPTPTYGAIDQVRRDVGKAIEKKSGPYKDDEEAILDQVYGVLSNDQQGVAESFGVGAVYERARNTVKKLKIVQKRSIQLFGEKLDKSIIPRLMASGEKLAKGDISSFEQLLKILPPSQRQAAVATMLNRLFTFGQRTGGDIGSGFVGAFEALKRNPSMKKAIFDELPDGALKRFNDIGEVATGIFRSKALQNNSGTANAILANMDNGGIANKILKSRRLASPFSKFGRALSFTAAFLTKVLPKKTQTAADLLTSPAFKKSLEDAALGKKVSAENITKTKIYSNWFDLLDGVTQRNIATIGFIPWLLEEEDPRLNLTLSPVEER